MTGAVARRRHDVAVEVAGPWSLATCQRFWEGFTPAALTGSTGGDRLRTVFRVDHDRSRAELEATQDGATAHRALTGDGDLDAAATQASRFLSPDVDARDWPDVGRRDPVVAEARRRLSGLRPCGFHSPYEDGAFPAPERLRALDLDLPGRKTEYLRAVDPAETIAGVQEITGLGPFAAELVVLRGANRPDAVPRHERRFDDEITHRYGPGRTLAEVSANWRPFRTWAAVHLRVLREERTEEIGGRSPARRRLDRGD